MPIYRATVTYWYYSPPRGGRFKVYNYTITCNGRTESAVIAALRKKHPGKEFEIQEIQWK